MRRYYRFSSPGWASAALGAAVLVLAGWPELQLVGGLATTGWYALALQVSLSLFLLTAIDDLQQPLMPRSRRRNPPGRAPADRTSGILRELLTFYLVRPLPALLLAFGFAVSTATIAIGALGPSASALVFGVHLRLSEITLVAVLALTVGPQLARPAPGCLGWCAGFAAGCACARIGFDPAAEVSLTILGWAAAAAVAGLVWLSSRAVVSVLARRSARGRTVASAR